MELNPTVSIIVPVYNVESFIERCAHSLMEQSYTDIEFIFVNDHTPDRSIDLLKQVIALYPRRLDQVIIVDHSVNKGLPSARNTGLAIARGAYIFHCDSDDWVESSMIQDMVEHAKKEDADVVYTDWYLSFTKSERYMHQMNYTNTEDCVRAMLQGGMKYNVWNKLIKKSLYDLNGISFPEGMGMGEDMTIIKLFCKAKNVSYIPQAYYHYMQTNPNAFTKGFTKRNLEELKFNSQAIVDYVQGIQGADRFKNDLQYFKLNVKLPFLISDSTLMYDTWREWFREAHPFISRNPAFNFRTRFIQYAAINRQNWLLKLYNFILAKIIYGWYYK